MKVQTDGAIVAALRSVTGGFAWVCSGVLVALMLAAMALMARALVRTAVFTVQAWLGARGDARIKLGCMGVPVQGRQEAHTGHQHQCRSYMQPELQQPAGKILRVSSQYLYYERMGSSVSTRNGTVH
ncbi:MAG: hypothetical protein NTV94_19855 [Planctomycetota bacterium]|nr:hypothetical protein [Planctomycetota bacterium]